MSIEQTVILHRQKLARHESLHPAVMAYERFIRKNPGIAISFQPPDGNGGFFDLPTSVQEKCGIAVADYLANLLAKDRKFIHDLKYTLDKIEALQKEHSETLERVMKGIQA
jgi:hypothetical protein